jgi:hypothetical protein
MRRKCIDRGTSLTTILIFVLAQGTTVLSASSPAAEGGLSIVTDPAGASVYINGESKGITPLELDRVAVGEHRITVLKDGYLENSRVVRVEEGQRQAVELRLTSSEGRAHHEAQIEPGGDDDGGVPKWVWVAAAAGGGTAAYFALRETNQGPLAGTVAITPSTGLQAAQTFAIIGQGASDPDGDTLTYNWDLGDGTTASGPSVSKVYNNAGNFTATVTVRDDKEQATASGTVTVRGMSGNWSGVISGFGDFSMNLTQNDSGITGTYSDFIGTANLAGSVSSPNGVRITARNPCCAPFTFQGTMSGDVNSVTGMVTGSGFNHPFTLTRQ